MQQFDLALLGAIGVAAGVSLLLPGEMNELTVIVLLLGMAIAVAVISGYGGRFLLLCLGEAFAVGLGTETPVLGIAFQPVIAGIVCGENRMSLLVGGVSMTVFSAGVLLFRFVATSLVILISGLIGSALILLYYESRLKHRLSRSETA
ncbi:MAG TPA: hypothetical protein PLI31_05315 [Methanoregulaceae archaeon]|nr:hypothetical protein [Methanoregulaceae archaeon]